MRGRWGSVESLEKIFFNARNHIGAVFQSAFGKLVQKKEAKKEPKREAKMLGKMRMRSLRRSRDSTEQLP